MWRLFLTDLCSACYAAGLPSFPVPSSSSLPPPVPLLYGVSEAIFPHQPFWPKSVHLCGYWQLDDKWLPALNAQLVELIKGLPHPVLYAGFGSMEHYIEESGWVHFVATIDNGVLHSWASELCHVFSSVQVIISVHTPPLPTWWAPPQGILQPQHTILHYHTMDWLRASH